MIGIFALLGVISLFMLFGLRSIIWGIIEDIIGSIILMTFESYIRPKAEQLLPALYEQIQLISGQFQLFGEQIQLLPTSIAVRNIRRVILYGASGLVDGTSLIIGMLVLMILFGFIIFLGFQFDAQRKRLIENENPMKLLPKIIFFTLSSIILAISFLGWYELQLAGAAVTVNKIFDWNLVIIAPYISEQEEEDLKSKYALMTTRQDVQAIDARMLAVMRENGIPVDEAPASEPSAKHESAAR